MIVAPAQLHPDKRRKRDEGEKGANYASNLILIYMVVALVGKAWWWFAVIKVDWTCASLP